MTLHDLEKKNESDVRWVFKSLVVHPEVGTLPAQAGCAALKQGKFWQMEAGIFDGLWDVSGEDPAVRDKSVITQDGLEAIATKVGLDLTQFRNDMGGKECAEFLQKNGELLEKLGVHATPSFYINGRFVGGAVPEEEFQKIIDEEKAKADAAYKTGVKPEDYYNTIVRNGKKSLE